ncbi:MAG: hypothetical protein Q7T25_08670, partial [Sideroxyarcus sp.]|nr:hypothetical protein [Sideroxyarcus sp.]
MNKLNLFFILAAAFVLSACSPKADHNSAKSDAHAEHGHDHGGSGIALTNYTDATELFVEFQKLVKGEQTSFAAHTTLIIPAGFQAVTEGKMTVVLSGDGQPE